MEKIKGTVPSDFIAERTRLTWREVEYGIEEGLLAPASAVEIAMEELAAAEEYGTALVELAARRKGESVHPYVEDLASAEPEQAIGDLRAKWLYLALAWVEARKVSYRDPLEIVERIYAEFDYPDRVAQFVRSAAADEPDLGSVELNEARLHKKWRAFLEEEARKYASSKRGG